MVSLELKNLSKSYGPRRVFSGISRSIDSGCLVVTGRNGSGKSTLLKIVAGLLSPTNGEVIFKLDGREVDKESPRDLVGLVSPELSLYSELSALENLKFLCKVRGLKKHDSELVSLLEKLGLDGRESDRLSSYSSGMLQRVKYASAMLHDPQVMLFDEPSANLDESGIEIVASIIEEHKKRGIVVIATNDQSDMRFGDSFLELGV